MIFSLTFFHRSSVLLALYLLLVACAPQSELKTNNDPSKYSLTEDVRWSSPDGFDLTMDIYTPLRQREAYPVLVMFHGGGWLMNDNSIMDQAAAYIATNSDYVVCNVNYRLLSDNENTTTLDEIVGDAFGALLWVKENIIAYQGDKTRIAVTGDSAGAHLAAMIVNTDSQLSSEVFSESSPKFSPSYLPNSMSAESVREVNGLSVQAAVLSYGLYDLYQVDIGVFESMRNPLWWINWSMARGFFGDGYSVVEQPSMYKAVSPLHNIPDAKKRMLPPQLLTVGSEDPVVTPESVKHYLRMLQVAGQKVSYWEYEGKSHAFLDSGSNSFLGSSFESDAPKALDVMISFLNKIFYPS